MTLDEYMNTIDRKETVFVGAKVCFLFIGNKPMYDYAIDFVSLKALNYSHDALAKELRRKEFLESKITDGVTGKVTEKDILKANRELASVSQRIDRIQKVVSDFTPIRNRKIKEDPYKRYSGDGTIVLIEGIEEGKYWFKDEFDTFIKNQRLRGCL